MERPDGTRENPPNSLVTAASDFLKMLRFYSRLPAPAFSFEKAPLEMPDFSRAIWALPFAGAVIGAVGAAVGLAAFLVGISGLVSATLTIAVLVVITGAFHEDGLADCCDGLFGGQTPERRLEIMKDSRIGTFGGSGLVLSLALRIFALADLFRLVGPAALLLVIGIAALSRVLALAPVLVLSPAAATGLAARASMPAPIPLAGAALIGLAILAVPASMLDLLPGLAIVLFFVAAILLVAIRLARAKIGGHTGDLLGACQQLVEITLLIGLSASANLNGAL